MTTSRRLAVSSKPCHAPRRALPTPDLRPRTVCLAIWAALAPVAAQAADGLTDLGLLNGGSVSEAKGLSADVNVVVGLAIDGAAGNFNRAFLWTQVGGLVSLGTLNGGSTSQANAVSADGSVVVGQSGTTAGPRAFRWTQAGGMVSLGALNGGSDSSANGVSADGSAVVGNASDGALGNATRAFRWTQAGGMVSLGTLNGGSTSFANGVSADGSAVVGNASDGALGNATRAFRWTQAGGMVSLGTLNGGNVSRAFGVSADGSVVVGVAADGAAGNANRAFRWTQAGGMVSLGTLGGSTSRANAVSADGTVVVGQALNNVPGFEAFRWTQATGMQSILQWLSTNGVAVDANLSLLNSTANATNADGSVVVGRLGSSAFLARVLPPQPPTPAVPATLGVGSGLIDVADFMRTVRVGTPVVAAQVQAGADLILNGLHGNPLQGLPRAGGYNVWVAGDWGRQENVRGDGDIGAGEIGLGWGLDEHIAVKLAFGRSDSRQDGLYGGGSTQRGTYLAPELVAGLPGSPLRFSVSGYYAQGESNIRRGYLNAGTPVTAAGSPDYASWGARLRADWVNALTLFGTGLTPYLSFTHSRSRLDGYTEAGGGFPVRWEGRSDKSDIARLGIDAAHSLNNGIKLLARMDGAHRLEKKSSDSQGRLLGPGGFAFTLDGLDYRRDWLRLGLGAEGKVGPGTAAFMTNATTQTNGARYWASLSYRIDF